MQNPQRKVEQRAKAIFERSIALDLVANVTNGRAACAGI
jgi:hypothetical protein